MTDLSPLYKDISKELHLGRLDSYETIQSLWGGYGELIRLNFEKMSIIVKHIKLPKQTSHPKGWNTNASHMRKLHSYEVETNWYENFCKINDDRCRVPKAIKCFHTKTQCLIVMEDLASVGFTHTFYEANEEHIISCINWLANFHGKYMGRSSSLLWEIGTYWHLDTRVDELKALEDLELKKYAKKIDAILNEAKYQTFVHGDAKLANFCFSSDALSCAAVDFQYVGQGCGMKDLVYFISSAIEPSEYENLEEWVLEIYFNALENALKFYKKDIDFMELKKEYTKLYPIAWADFQRFIKGWSPKHFKVNRFSQAITNKAIAELKEI